MIDPTDLGDEMVDHFSLPAYDASQRPERVPAGTIKSSKTRVDDRAILLSRLNPRFPRLWYAVPNQGVVALSSTEFMVLRPGSGVSLADVWIACCQSAFRQEMVQRATGTSGSHQRVRPDDVLSIEIGDPRERGEGVRGIWSLLLDMTERARRETEVLATLRDALLPELLSGRLSVNEIVPITEVAG